MTATKNVDRTAIVPPDTGDTILPNSPFFSRLVRFAHDEPAPLAVRDVNLKLEKTYLQLLTDVLAVRNSLRDTLPSRTLRDIAEGVDTFVGVLAPGGYEYTVAVLAVLALGAAVVPMSTAVPLEEALYFINKSRQSALLYSASIESFAVSIAAKISSQRGTALAYLNILPLLRSFPLPPHDIVISSDLYLDDNAAGMVIFTSGTTSRPKGSVMRRGYIHDAALANVDPYAVTPQDVLLHVLPVHHAAGIGLIFFTFLFGGALIEFKSGSFDPQWTWERWRRGGLTYFSGVPTIYMRMKRYFEQSFANLPSVEKEGYMQGVQQFKVLLCGTQALPEPIASFWEGMRGGRRILSRYGATETGAVLKIRLGDRDVPDGSIGEVTPGVQLKLSDQGEIMVKTPHMFSGYLDDEPATRAAHDENGWFKTGDIARREGKYYFILGRASLDIIKSGGYKISALEIEREVLSLPYIEEVMVVGVDDEEFGQRVAALISLRHDQDVRKLSIDQLRDDLSQRLARYKMPTLLRVVEGEFPKGSSGKVLKKTLGPQMFPRDWEGDEIQVWRPKARSKL